jgi:hypothetical protein
MGWSAVGRVPPIKRSNSPDAAVSEHTMPALFVVSALCALSVLTLRPILSLIGKAGER